MTSFKYVLRFGKIWNGNGKLTHFHCKRYTSIHSSFAMSIYTKVTLLEIIIDFYVIGEFHIPIFKCIVGAWIVGVWGAPQKVWLSVGMCASFFHNQLWLLDKEASTTQRVGLTWLKIVTNPNPNHIHGFNLIFGLYLDDTMPQQMHIFKVAQSLCKWTRPRWGPFHYFSISSCTFILVYYSYPRICIQSRTEV